MKVSNKYLSSTQWIFHYYKDLCDKTLAQINEQQLHWQCNTTTNSIAIIIQHLSGNMLSRWTDFLTTDGEKPWRDRDGEFEILNVDKASLLNEWEKGWDCLFGTFDSLTENDLIKTVYIRNEPHTVIEAINRQLGHVAYHVGQIVLIAKMLLNENWETLSIPKGKSKELNMGKFLKK
ncbi:MAG TPA: DUF1572 family protein [Chitinophagaceae bacterium]|nr:DUF1572 family protein [Chitinophagaceae bacterium]